MSANLWRRLCNIDHKEQDCLAGDVRLLPNAAGRRTNMADGPKESPTDAVGQISCRTSTTDEDMPLAERHR
jgi:hypothetical protein